MLFTFIQNQYEKDNYYFSELEKGGNEPNGSDSVL